MADISHNSGNVGIGTSTPLAPLHVASGSILVGRPGYFEQDVNFTGFGSSGTWARGLFFTSGGITAGFGVSGIYTTTGHTVDNIFLGHGASPWSSGTGLYVLRNGNVGVGTTSPTVKLDVNGDIKATNITASGNITATNITASGTLTLTGKATSAATVATDSATILSTKDYVESRSRVGSTLCFSKQNISGATAMTVAGVTIGLQGTVAAGNNGSSTVTFTFPSGTKWSGFAYRISNGGGVFNTLPFDAAENIQLSAFNEQQSSSAVIIATRVQ